MKRMMKNVLSFVLAFALILSGVAMTSATEAKADAAGETLAVGQSLTFTGTSTPGYTFDSSVLGTTDPVGAMVFNISIDLPLEGDVAWNDWCGEAVAVNTADGTSYYDFGGAQVTWGSDIDGDTVADTTGAGTASWVGTAANGACTIVVPVNAAEFTIDIFDNCWDSATDISHMTINSATPIYGSVSGTEIVNIGQAMSYTGTAAAGYTFDSSAASAGTAAAVVFNISVALPAEGDVTWNDWCGEAAKVTAGDSVAYYDFGGAQVSWGSDLDGDTVADTTGVGTASWAGSAVNGTMSVVIPVGADTYTIDLFDNCWDSAADIDHLVVNSATVVYGEGGPAAAAADEAPAVSADQTAFLMFSDRNWNYGNWDSTLESATTTVSGAGSYSVTLNKADVAGEAVDPVTGAEVFCVDVIGAGTYYSQTGESLMLESLEVLCDGNPVAVDASKVLFGDIEDNGNFRIEIYNEFGNTLNDPAIDVEGFTFNDTLTVNFSVKVGNPYEKETTAFLMFSDRNWEFGNWDSALESATTKVLGDGTYTVTLNAAEVGGDGVKAANGAQVFCVDVEGIGALVPDITAIQVSDVKVLADGVEVPVDAAKIVSGDIEEIGNFRIELYNEYGATNADSPIDYEGLSFVNTLSVTFTLSGITYGAPYVEEVVKEDVVYEGEYFAGIGVQTNTSLWIFRNAWDDATYGYEVDPDFYNEGLHSVTGDEVVNYNGTFTDAVVDGDGTYTIKLNGADFATEDYFSMLFITTNIPVSDRVHFNDITCKINGKEVGNFATDEGLVKTDSTTYFMVMLQNSYTASQKDIIAMNFPISDIEITFTVEGLGYEGTGTVETAADPEPVVTEAPEVIAAPEVTEAPEVKETSEVKSAPEVTEAPAAPAEPAESTSNTGLIIGIIAGVVVAAGAVVAILLLKKKKKN